VLEQDVALPDDVKPVAPLAVTLSGSVYETGGRAVTRLLKRTYWPADALVGVRPLFDPKQGAESEAPAGFEIVRAGADGKRVAGAHLKVRLQRELRDFYWLYERDGGWKSDANQRLQLIEEKDVDVSAGQSTHVEFPVEWGSYRVEVYDPQTQLTTVFPFFAGYSWDDENLGKEARPDKVKLALDKGRYHAGDIEGAIAGLRNALAGDPASPKLHFMLANMLQRASRWAEAVDEYEAVVELQPAYFPALTRLAYLYFRQGLHARAVETWRRALPVCDDPALRRNIELFMRKLVADMSKSDAS